MTINSITININGTTYERVEAKYPELQCEECDWHAICGNEFAKNRYKAIAFCTGCKFIEPNNKYVFKKVK